MIIAIRPRPESHRVHCGGKVCQCAHVLRHSGTGGMEHSGGTASDPGLWAPGLFPTWFRFVSEVDGAKHSGDRSDEVTVSSLGGRMRENTAGPVSLSRTGGEKQHEILGYLSFYGMSSLSLLFTTTREDECFVGSTFCLSIKKKKSYLSSFNP